MHLRELARECAGHGQRDTQKLSNLYCSLLYRQYQQLELPMKASWHWQCDCRSEPRASKIPLSCVCGKFRARVHTTAQTRQCIIRIRVSGGALRPAAVSTMAQEAFVKAGLYLQCQLACLFVQILGRFVPVWRYERSLRGYPHRWGSCLLINKYALVLA